MKLITLNIWGGHVKQPLLDFIDSHREIDIFCLQEVYHQAQRPITNEAREIHLNILSEINDVLQSHHTLFKPVVNNIYGIAMLIKQDIKILAEGELAIYHNPNYSGVGPSHSRIIQWLTCQHNGQAYSILNMHGLWNGKGKTDSPERIQQSETIKQFLDGLATPKLLCGDFNLRPDTTSFNMLKEGMDDWIQVHAISDTRTSYYPKPERFADYILTSPDIRVNHFSVLNDVVSDHAPLFIDFI